MHRPLKINPEFQNLIAPLTHDEFQQLEQNIISNGGCRDTIKVWRNYIIDGHNRYAICQKHNLPYYVQDLPLSSKTAAKIWIADNQLGRRNLSKAMRIELACLKLGMNQSRKTIAKAAGVSEQSVSKYMKIVGEGSAELINRVRNGELKINTAHKNLLMSGRTTSIIYDDNDPLYKNTPMCHENVLYSAADIVKLYVSLNKALPQTQATGDSNCKITKRLKAQLIKATELVEKVNVAT